MPQSLATAALGNTGLEVTRLGYGAMEVRGEPRGRSVSEEEARDILNSVLDSGINYIDTSIDYGNSEEFIGKCISGRRSEFYLASKCGCTVGDVPRGHVYTRENIVAGVNQSLSRMRTDYLDLVQFHGNPSRQDLEDQDAIQTLLDLKQEGKIRHLGASSVLPNLADHLAVGVFDAFQIPYSALERQHETWITKAARAGIGTIIRGGVAKGEPGAGQGREERWAKFAEAGLDELREEGEGRTAFMLRFTLSHPDMHTTIVGTQNPEHLRENLKAAMAGPRPADVYDEAKRRLAAEGVAPEAG